MVVVVLAIAFLIMLIVGTLLIPFVQLLLQLLVALGELLYRRGEDLYFSFQCVGGILSLLVDSSH